MKHVRIKIGVMGSAQGPTITQKENIKKAEKIGEKIADSGCVLVNGACPGLPNDAARGAKKAGGFVVGISPGFSMREHIEKYNSPSENYDLILFTGMGLMERDIVNIRSSDAVIIVGGGIGTLNEFTVAYEEGKYVGVLVGSGGISDHIMEVLEFTHREANGRIIFESDPEKLVEKVVKALKTGTKVVIEDERIVNPDFDPFDDDKK